MTDGQPATAAQKPPCPMHGCKIPEHLHPATATPFTRLDVPYCQYGPDGTITVFVRDRQEVMRLTFAAAEDLAENMVRCAEAGRQAVKP